MKKLVSPLTEKQVRALRAGDEMALSGLVITARDRAHRFLVEEAKPGELPFDLAGAVIYHCGPLVSKTGREYQIVSAGPTTSARMNPYMGRVLRKFGVRGIIGKGGMDEVLLPVFKELGVAYFSAVGGAGVLLANRIVQVRGHFKLKEFGTAECFWILEVDELPLVVGMDARGRSLYGKVETRAHNILQKLLSGRSPCRHTHTSRRSTTVWGERSRR